MLTESRKEYVRDVVEACLRSKFTPCQAVDSWTEEEISYALTYGENFGARVERVKGRKTLYFVNLKKNGA